jgi:ketosteroid isomerase-like protein
VSQENVEVVRRLFDAVASRDTATVLSLYDRDLEWDGSRSRWAEVLHAEASFKGHEGLRRFSRAYYEMWESFHDEIQELIDAGDDVISVVTTRGRGRASGIDVEWRGNAGVWTIRGGKIAKVVWFSTRAQALKAAGLEE